MLGGERCCRKLWLETGAAIRSLPFFGAPGTPLSTAADSDYPWASGILYCLAWK